MYLMFCWPCIIVQQYNETNVMHFSFSLLRIKDFYMFWALLAHPREVLHKRHLLYCVHVKSVGGGTVAVSLQPCHSQLTYAHNIPNSICGVHPEEVHHFAFIILTLLCLCLDLNWKFVEHFQNLLRFGFYLQHIWLAGLCVVLTLWISSRLTGLLQLIFFKYLECHLRKTA
jgi:hypothetical protein